MREFARAGVALDDRRGRLQPGQRVLELAAGLGETGMLAAELVAPLGGVVVSDQAEAMLEGARARALELGLSNVEFQVLNAEWIDLPVASVDAVLCRWGYMLMADPAAALAETRRVLRPGGRVALAVWDALAAQPVGAAARAGADRAWAGAGARRRRRAARRDRSRSATPERVRELLEQAGFVEVARRGARARPPPRELRGAVGDDARPLAQLPRRGALAPGVRDRRDRAVAGRALRAVHRRRRDARDPGAHARGVGERLSALPAPAAPSAAREARVG